MSRALVPRKLGTVRVSLGLTKAQLAKEAHLQPGMVAWIESGRFVPYETQLIKIAESLRKYGWQGDTESLMEDALYD